MTSPDLHSLLDRVREATGPSRELDEDIHAALFAEHSFGQLKDAPQGVGCEMYTWNSGVQQSALRVSSSLDAVVALIEEKLPGWQRASGTCGEQDMPWACLTEPDEPYRDFAADAPDEVLALLAALLQALIEVHHDEA